MIHVMMINGEEKCIHLCIDNSVKALGYLHHGLLHLLFLCPISSVFHHLQQIQKIVDNNDASQRPLPPTFGETMGNVLGVMLSMKFL